MAIFSGEVTIKVRFKDIQVAVGYGMTSAIIKHRCDKNLILRLALLSIALFFYH